MHYLAYVVGENPAKTLAKYYGDLWDWYAVGGRWGHLSRLPRTKLPVPSYIIYQGSDGVSFDEVGEDRMKKALGAISPKDRITVVDLHM